MSEINAENKNRKQGLGRGLGSLLSSSSGLRREEDHDTSSVHTPPAPRGTASELPSSTNSPQAVPSEARVWQIQVEKLQPSKLQPRTQFEKDKLEELAASIRQHGILQPIVARKIASGAFEIIAGERRWRAAQMAGLHEVPTIIKTFGNKEALELAIIENIQREDLSPLEEAEAYQRLIAEFGLTQQLVAEKVGKDRATVANSLRLLSLPEAVKTLVKEGLLSSGHCKVLLGLEDGTLLISLAKKAASQDLSVRKLEKEIGAIKLKTSPSEAKDEALSSAEVEKKKQISRLQEELQRLVSTKVTIEYAAGRGSLAFQFYSDEGLNELVDCVRQGVRS